MEYKRVLLFFLCITFWGESFAMNQMEMEKAVKDMVADAKGEKGVVEFSYNKVKMYLLSDVKHDRMRVVSPIAYYEKLSKDQIDAVMESNFHRALDARYAVSEGVLYSVYVHPLSELTPTQLESGVYQVANLALSFGSQYTSGVLNYGGK